jgi:hypothetical protein
MDRLDESAARSGQAGFLAPGGVVFEREEALDRLGAAGSGLKEGLDGLPQLPESAVGRVVRGAAGSPVDPIERGGKVEDLAPRLQKISVNDLGDIPGRRHGDAAPSGRGWLASELSIAPSYTTLITTSTISLDRNVEKKQHREFPLTIIRCLHWA